MGRELCFCIEKKELYLEQVLVDYMEVPIFFLCKDEIQYYVALCTDMDELSYIAVKVSVSEVYCLLHGEVPMRDVILNQKEYWEIVSGEEISQDVVVKHSIGALDGSLLPQENACFEILTEEMEEFVQEFDKECCESKKDPYGDGMPYIDMSGLNLNIGKYFDLGVCFLPQQSMPGIILYENYTIYSEKKVTLQNFDRLEKWSDDISINIAA